ncbi:SCO-spondin-like [Hydra vulgaris]|uniref:SCO-spondin-like n=1 Tax=Hydra vulgaris TaxID=6087 RepID=A0ABM4C3V2_HYDVU
MKYAVGILFVYLVVFVEETSGVCLDWYGKPCKVDEVLSEWSKFSACSASCGDGIQTRQRTCLNPSSDGKNCIKALSETQNCNLGDCKIDGGLSVWSKFFACSVSCGNGFQTRQRTCTNPVPSGGGKNCIGVLLETQSCILRDCKDIYGVCFDWYGKLCKVDGGLSVWSKFSECSASCGDGIQSRQRTCSNPVPSGGGKNCVGVLSETQSCILSVCKGNNSICSDWYGRSCKANEVLSEWSKFSACSASCGDGRQTRQRTCTNPSVGKKNCSGSLSETQNCNLGECQVDGGLSDWSPYSDCSVSCGQGIKKRVRTCTNPVPSGGGKDCVGDLSETGVCYFENCIVDGGLSDWSPYSDCSVSCGQGIKKRVRTCTNPVPSGGGKDCVGDLSETGVCYFENCIVDGGLSDWSPYSDCSVSCGQGIKKRVRTCTNPVPSGGGKDCVGDLSETGVCYFENCIVDGGLSDWSPYSDCSVSCGQGIKKRVRTCTNPVPSGGGKDCVGDLSETGVCYFENCIVDGGLSDWSPYSDCSVSCGQGIKKRVRTCTNPVPSGGGKDCVGDLSETGVCYFENCIVDGGLSDWSPYSDCSVSCGQGIKKRVRTCTNPVPSGGGKDCVGDLSETGVCYFENCIVDGGLSDWSPYSDCSVSCGQGIKKRVRTCTNPVPSGGGKDCVGDLSETGVCYFENCIVDGGLSDWSPYSDCSVSCGQGIKKRVRTCTNPVPSGGGKDCVGDLSETGVCYFENCIVNGGLSKWSQYSACSVSCGNGTQTRFRTCTNPAPSGGGKDCIGDLIQTTYCNMQICKKKVNGGFSMWTDFSVCTKTCAGGVQTRTRECNNPKPENGGQKCDGMTKETRGCKNNFCPGPAGVINVLENVNEFFKIYFASNTGMPITGKSLKVMFEIQNAVSAEYVSVDPAAIGPFKVLLKKLERILLIAANRESFDFARITLGKLLFYFLKKGMADGLPIHTISKASEDYLNLIKSQVGSKKFSQIVSPELGSTLMFVIDTTSSMSKVINAVTNIIKALIEEKSQYNLDYILSPYNDPDIGPVVHKRGNQVSELLDVISKYKVYNGGDCPEPAFGGMLSAFNKSPQYGSSMFVFTDASAKDGSRLNLDALKAVASSYASSITFFANPMGCDDEIDSFEEIASYTSGHIFHLSNNVKEMANFTPYIKSSLQHDTVITRGELLNGSRIKNFFVDDGIEKIIVLVSTTAQNAHHLIQLRYENELPVSPTLITSMAKIYLIRKSKKRFSGKWTILFPSNVENCKYSVEAISNDPIEFHSSFVYQQQPSQNSSVYLFSNPIKGIENLMIIRLEGEKVNLSSFKCQFVDMVGGSSVDLTLLMKENGVFFSKITPPDSQFKLRCYGRTKSGSEFERLSVRVSEAKSTFLIPTFAGNLHTVRSSNFVNAQFMIFNFGNEELITFTVKTSQGSIFPKTQTLNIKENALIEFKYGAPSDSSLVGTTTRITVSGQRHVSREEFTSTLSLLIV